MYSMKNVRYFLEEKTQTPKEEIEEIINNLKSQIAINVGDEDSLVVSGAIEMFLDENTAKNFHQDFQNDFRHLQIISSGREKRMKVRFS